MKKILLFMALFLLLFTTFVIADNGQGQQVQAQQEDTSDDIDDEEDAQEKPKSEKARNVTELKAMIQERKELHEQELAEMKAGEQKVFRNQNAVRLAVHSLLAMENLTGIGKQVSEVAREFDNSVQATIRAEQRIQLRNALIRFFAGGDEQAADEIQGEVQENQERITSLRQLHKECQCNEEVKAMMQEQIQNMEQEQNRLQELSQNEKKSKGLFGWLWK